MKLLLGCRASAELLSRSQDHPLPLVIRARIRLHLMTCPACRNLDAQMRFVRKAMRVGRVHPPTDAPPEEGPP